MKKVILIVIFYIFTFDLFAQEKGVRFTEIGFSGLFINTNNDIARDLGLELNWWGIGLGLNAGLQYSQITYWIGLGMELGVVKKKDDVSAQMFGPNISVNLGYNILKDTDGSLNIHLGIGFNHSILLVGEKNSANKIDILESSSTSYVLNQVGCFFPFGIKLSHRSTCIDIQYRIPIAHFKQTPYGSKDTEINDLSNQNIFPLSIGVGYKF